MLKFIKKQKIYYENILLLDIEKYKNYLYYINNIDKIINNFDNKYGIYTRFIYNLEDNYYVKIFNNLYNIDNYYIYPCNEFIIINKEIMNYVYNNKLNLYNLLNRNNSFDYVWFINKYNLLEIKNIKKLYYMYKKNNLFGNGYIDKLNLENNNEEKIDNKNENMMEDVFNKILIGVLKKLNKSIYILNQKIYNIDYKIKELNIFYRSIKIDLIKNDLEDLNDSKLVNKIFNKYYNKNEIELNEYLKNQKIRHRYICLNFIKNIRKIDIKDFGEDNTKETVLIEFRNIPHVEYLIRNTIIKLPKWNHTIVCGNDNYILIKEICKNICKNTKSVINIIKLDINNLYPSDYSKILLNINFWKLFNGDKLLIYQEDSILFHGKIDNFLKYDWIGAPWPINQDDNLYGVGNGGFSLRDRKKLINCIENVKTDELELGESTKEYIRNTNSYFVPEDVFFSKSMIDYKLGNVAKRDIALEFSQETQKSINPLGGHNFWLGECKNYKYFNLFYLKDDYYTTVEHRYGWKCIIKNCIKNNIIISNEKYNIYKKILNNINFIDNKNILNNECIINNEYIIDNLLKNEIETNILNNENNLLIYNYKFNLLIDCMESYFLFNNNDNLKKEWYGIIHYTNELPKIYDKFNLTSVINKCKESLKYCKGIITLSNYIKKELIKLIGNNIPIYMIKHPIEEISKKFNLDNFINKNDYNIIQLGQQYRKIYTIYLLKSKYNKIWLPGTKDFKKLDYLLKEELKYLNIKCKLNNVNTIYTKTVEEFDELLLNNIIIIPLWNASANNSLLECLEMNIPFFITRLPATEEYLGKEYPMFFTNIKDLEYYINNKNNLIELYKKTYFYILNIDKSDIRYECFNSNLLRIVNS